MQRTWNAGAEWVWPAAAATSSGNRSDSGVQTGHFISVHRVSEKTRFAGVQPPARTVQFPRHATFEVTFRKILKLTVRSLEGR